MLSEKRKALANHLGLNLSDVAEPTSAEYFDEFLVKIGSDNQLKLLQICQELD